MEKDETKYTVYQLLLAIVPLPLSSKNFSTGSTSMFRVAICSSLSGSGNGKTFSCANKKNFLKWENK